MRFRPEKYGSSWNFGSSRGSLLCLMVRLRCSELAVLVLTVGLVLNVLLVHADQQGPRFEHEPPGLMEFTNTKEASVACQATGKPPPAVRWIKLPDGVAAAEVPGLRYVRPDGSLVFPKFAAKDFRQDVHSTLYSCVATNSVGTIASRDVKVRAVVSQPFEVRAYDEFVTRGNAALFRCHLPSFAKDVLIITGWLRDDGLLIHSPLAEGTSPSFSGGAFLAYLRKYTLSP